jgi:hypothetical protein
MKGLMIYPAIALTVFVLCFSACSKGKDAEPAKGKIEKMTDQAAEAAMEKIRTPLDKARAVQKMGEERMKAADESMEEQ